MGKGGVFFNESVEFVHVIERQLHVYVSLSILSLKTFFFSLFSLTKDVIPRRVNSF